MYKDKTIAVVVPAYNEERQICVVIETMPEFVDRIVIVNDFSNDKTYEHVIKYLETRYNRTDIVTGLKNSIERNRFNEAEEILFEQNKNEKKYFTQSEIINRTPDKDRIIIINHKKNAGVGASIASGYKWCKDNNIDCTAVMNGDAQMDPSELESICKPVLFSAVDYVKGNRLIHGSARTYIPKIRFFGNSVLSILTKIASGYWRISDTQSGYTAISLAALNSIKLYKIYPGYGMPNDILVKLNTAYCTLREVPIKPVYRVGEKSKMRIIKVIPAVSFLLLKNFFKRIWIKYFLKDFHPLFILYHLAFILFLLCILPGINIIKYLAGEVTGDRPILNSILFMFLFISAFQSLLFAMWMDIQDNDRLYK